MSVENVEGTPRHQNPNQTPHRATAVYTYLSTVPPFAILRHVTPCGGFDLGLCLALHPLSHGRGTLGYHGSIGNPDGQGSDRRGPITAAPSGRSFTSIHISDTSSQRESSSHFGQNSSMHPSPMGPYCRPQIMQRRWSSSVIGTTFGSFPCCAIGSRRFKLYQYQIGNGDRKVWRDKGRRAL